MRFLGPTNLSHVTRKRDLVCHPQNSCDFAFSTMRAARATDCQLVYRNAIADNRVPPFKTLCSTTRHEFYGKDPGSNDSQALCLCYYLPEQGLLTPFYHEFRKNAATDLTGYQTLQSVLGADDMDAVKQRWEVYTAGLRF